jgi:hypothetical protein
VAATGNNKVYDSTTVATVSLNSNALAGDTVTLANTSASFIDKNVGTAKTVNVFGISIAGADAGNYTNNTTTTTIANITPAPLIISATGENKVFDGTTTAAVTLSDNRIPGDTFTTSNSAANFSNATIGQSKTVTVIGISAAGSDASNYSYNSTAITTASITTPAIVPNGESSTIIDAINSTVMGQLAVVPITPLTTGSLAPILIQRDTTYGGITSIPIVPLGLLGMTSVVKSEIENGINAAPASSTFLLGTQPGRQPGMLTVSQAALPSQLLTLYPAQPIKPVGPYVAPLRLPRQGRN